MKKEVVGHKTSNGEKKEVVGHKTNNGGIVVE
jgi:hypothetical protein